jgi:DNA-binding transcriptional regulator YiaG
MPKPSSVMNERERQICRRVRVVRNWQRLPQSEFARLLTMTRDKLAAVEAEYSPLRFDAAQLLCERFNVCQRWLADGSEPVNGRIKFSLSSLSTIKPRELFSAAYDRVLSFEAMRAVKQAWETAHGVKLYEDHGGTPEKSAEHYAALLQTIWFRRFDIQKQMELFRWLNGAAAQFAQSQASHGMPTPNQVLQNLSLTDAETAHKVSSVKAQLPGLLERLKRATAETGKKSELAEFLKAPLASVSRWLSGEREPGGEVALQMLYWVEQQERKK